MENNPYEGFDVGVFSNNMEAFSTVLKYEDFDSIFRNGIGEAGCFINTSYVGAFNTYVTDKIFEYLSDINKLVEKRGDLATKISDCNTAYSEYITAYDNLQKTPKTISYTDPNGNTFESYNFAWDTANDTVAEKKDVFSEKKRLVDEFDISVGGDN